MKKIAAAIVGAGVIVVLACGGQESFACGNTTCSGDDVCIHPCCGGAAPHCDAVDDAGVCPPDTTKVTSFQQCSNYDTTFQCLFVCTPPPPYCAPKGTYCQGNQQDPQNCFQGCA